MTTKSTSFRLSTSTLALLKQLAEKENRSLTNMIETLIRNRAKREGMQMPEEVDCTHEWRETDSQFNNESFTQVVCVKCGVVMFQGNETKRPVSVVSSYLTPCQSSATLPSVGPESTKKASSLPSLASSPTSEPGPTPTKEVSRGWGRERDFKGSRK